MPQELAQESPYATYANQLCNGEHLSKCEVALCTAQSLVNMQCNAHSMLIRSYCEFKIQLASSYSDEI